MNSVKNKRFYLAKNDEQRKIKEENVSAKLILDGILLFFELKFY